jgi:hypothetical protein
MVSSLSCPAQVDTWHSEGFFIHGSCWVTRHSTDPFSLNESRSCRVTRDPSNPFSLNGFMSRVR